MARHSTRLHVVGFGLALGITWGLGVLVIGILAWQAVIGGALVDLLATVYIGYQATLGGSIVGAVWGFFDAFVAGVIIAWLYNLCLKCPKTGEKPKLTDDE